MTKLWSRIATAAYDRRGDARAARPGRSQTPVDTGQADLAALLSGLEAQERYQNWPAISNAAGYTNSNAANLRASIASEQGAIDMYTHYARQAEQAGDSSVSGVFLGIKADEAGHRKAFTTELNQLARGN